MGNSAKHLTDIRLWLSAIILWAVTLFILSSLSKTMPDDLPTFPHIDKLLHFGYFFGGGIILTTYILLAKGVTSRIRLRILLPLFVFAIIGALDEYHQTFTPGRSGNDPFDWLADILGAMTGILIANAAHRLLLKISSR